VAESIIRVAVVSVVSGVATKLRGGEFKTGLVAALITKSISSSTGGVTKHSTEGAFAITIISGTIAAKATGGDALGGIMQATIVYLFNDNGIGEKNDMNGYKLGKRRAYNKEHEEVIIIDYDARSNTFSSMSRYSGYGSLLLGVGAILTIPLQPVSAILANGAFTLSVSSIAAAGAAELASSSSLSSALLPVNIGSELLQGQLFLMFPGALKLLPFFMIQAPQTVLNEAAYQSSKAGIK
jgi:hypothetical protein